MICEDVTHCRLEKIDFKAIDVGRTLISHRGPQFQPGRRLRREIESATFRQTVYSLTRPFVCGRAMSICNWCRRS